MQLGCIWDAFGMHLQRVRARERAEAPAFEDDIRHTPSPTEALNFQGLADEGEQAGIQVDFADEGEKRLSWGANRGGNFEAVDGRVALGAVPYLRLG